MALGAYPTLRTLRRQGRLDVLDAHFGYPDGYAAMTAGRWLRVPVAITLRGTESRHAADPVLKPLLQRALSGADRIFAVAESLRRIAIDIGTPSDKVRVIGNGVDVGRFFPVDRGAARRALEIPPDAKVLISVGGLVERKGFHRVIDCLPGLRVRYPNLHYVVVGGASPEGDWTNRLKSQVRELGLQNWVHFTGPMASDRLREPLSAADVFVLSTRNEGWANVFLEAMACGLPVVATDVGGNREVVCRAELGTIVPFDDRSALSAALDAALAREWDRDTIIDFARGNAWDDRVRILIGEFVRIGQTRSASSSRRNDSVAVPDGSPGKRLRP